MYCARVSRYETAYGYIRSIATGNELSAFRLDCYDCLDVRVPVETIRVLIENVRVP